MNDEITSDKVDSEKNSYNEYSIIDFCTKDSGILIAAITGTVAVWSYVIRYISACYQKLCLSYWNVDSSLVSSSESVVSIIGYAAISIVLSLCANSLIIASFDNHRIISKYNTCTKKIIETNVKKGNIKKTAIDENKIAKTQEMLDYQQNLDDNEKAFLIANAKNRSKKLKKLDSIELLINLTAALFLFFLATLFIEDLKSNCSTIEHYISCFALTFFTFSFAVLFNYFGMKHSISNEIKKKGIIEAFISATDEIEKSDYPIQGLISKGVKCFLKNSTFIYTSIYLMLIIVATMMIMPAVTQHLLNKQDTFKTITIDNTKYVSVYSDSTTMVLEEATISDDKITIDLSKQRIVHTEDISYQIMKFNKVSRLKIENLEKENVDKSEVK